MNEQLEVPQSIEHVHFWFECAFTTVMETSGEARVLCFV